MRSLPAFVIGLMLISGTASAQDCGPFFWFCQRPAEARIQPPLANEPPSPRSWDANLDQQSTGAYGRIDPSYQRRAVYYPSHETPGTIVVDVQNRFLYAIEGNGRATRYGIGVGQGAGPPEPDAPGIADAVASAAAPADTIPAAADSDGAALAADVGHGVGATGDSLGD